MAKSNAGTVSATAVLGVVAAAYHVCALIVDLESWAANARRFRADPTLVNLIRVLAAEGVFIGDLGLAG